MIGAIIVITIIFTAISIIITMVRKKVKTDRQKATPFECGFNPISYSRIPFSIHFFIIAIIFLIFDIEIVIVIPIIITIKSSITITWVITSTTFTLILLIGLIHEWKNGIINWAN